MTTTEFQEATRCPGTEPRPNYWENEREKEED